MKSVYKNIIDSAQKEEKLLAVLIDPDKMAIKMVSNFIEKVNKSIATHIFIGGSTVEEYATEKLVSEIKRHTKLPMVLFPGSVSQIPENADA